MISVSERLINLLLVLYSTHCYSKYKRIRHILMALSYNTESVLRDNILYVYLNNGCYRYYIKEDVLRFTSNSWYDDINTDLL